MTDDVETTQTEAEPTLPSGKKRSRFGVFLKWMLIVFGVMQLVMRTVWEPESGAALENLITAAQVVLSSFCIILWWFCFSPFGWKTVLQIGLPVMSLLIGWVCCIHSIDFDGDMAIHFRYKWEKSGIEELREFRQHAETASTEKILQVAEFSPEDMPAYRGINRDGVVTGPAIRSDWEAYPPAEIWRHPIGGGYSSFTVVDPVLITMEQRDKNEAVVCYEISTGQEFWEYSYPARFNALGGPGPRSTPTIYNNSVYAFGCYGDLFCLDLKTGEPKWHVNVLQQFGLPTTTWGMTSSPLIHNGNVIVNTGGLKNSAKAMVDQTGNGLVAYLAENGEHVWHSEGLAAPNLEIKEFKTGAEAIEGIEGLTIPGYSSPMLAQLAGEELILNFDGTALRGNDPANGSQLWKFPFTAGDYINVAQPILFDKDRVLISSGYGTGSAMLRVSREGADWQVEELWTSNRLRSKFSSSVLYDGYVYGLDEGMMVCIDPEDGKRLWKGRREGLRGKYGHGQMLLVNEHIVVLTESGDLVLIEPSPKELLVKGILNVLEEDVKTWNPLTIAYGKAFVRNAEEIACYDLRANPDEPTIPPVEEVTTSDSE